MLRQARETAPGSNAPKVLTLMGLTKWMEHRLWCQAVSSSGGDRRGRLPLTGALLADEPTGELGQTGQQILTLFRRIADRDGTNGSIATTWR
jgi:predicted ABC-type transport system involved in lysophospholipase L1 biosynthesis ATPase subunit